MAKLCFYTYNSFHAMFVVQTSCCAKIMFIQLTKPENYWKYVNTILLYCPLDKQGRQIHIQCPLKF